MIPTWLNSFAKNLKPETDDDSHQPDYAALEARILYSAVPLDVSTLEDIDSFDLSDIDAQDLDINDVSAIDGDALDSLSEWSNLGLAQHIQTGSSELIFIDGSIDDLDQLLADNGLLERPDAEIILLDGDTDGIQQITDALAGRNGVDAIHFVTHGEAGSVQLGNSDLNTESLNAYAGKVAQWGSALSSTGDILFYGCDLASTESGEELIESLSIICDCDVAASEDLTGHEDLGGNWELEFIVGTVETNLAFSVDTQQNWLGTLDITTGLVGHFEFEEGSGVDAVDSASGNTGNIVNSATWTGDSAVGSLALDFSLDPVSANAFVDVPDNPLYDFGSGEFSVAFWYNATTPFETARLIGSFDGFGSSAGFAIRAQTNGEFSLERTDGVASLNSYASGVFDGNWHQFTATVDATGDVAMYVDGVSQFVFGATGQTNINTTSPITFGAVDGLTGDYEGALDDVRIYNRALSAGDVNELLTRSTNTAPTFHGSPDGIAFPDYGNGGDEVGETIELASGQLLAVGQSNDQLRIARHNPDGTLDTSFNGTGYLVAAIGDSSYGYAVEEMSDGRLVVAGRTETAGTNEFLVARFNADGTLDTSFDADGIFTYDSAGSIDRFSDVAVLADGTVYAIGTGGETVGAEEVFVMKIQNDGTLDAGFGAGDGIVSHTPDTFSEGTAIAAQADGKIVIGGSTHDGSDDWDFYLARLNSDGSLDGSIRVPIDAGRVDNLTAIELTSTGDVIAVGRSTNGADRQTALVKIEGTTFSLDTGFNGDGIASDAIISFAEDVAVDGSGNIYVGGTRGFFQAANAAVAKFDSNGDVDTNFGVNGVTSIDLAATGPDFGRDLLLKSDGNLVLTGDVSASAPLIQMDANGVLDTAFGPDDTLGGSISYTEGSTTPVALDIDASIFDEELSAIDDFGGSSITFNRFGGVNPDDGFNRVNGSNLFFTGSTFALSGVQKGTYQSFLGQLILNFDPGTTNADVNEIIQSIGYLNVRDDNPPASVDIQWTFNDGNTGAQGNGGALEATGITTVNITPVNDLATSDLDVDDSSGATGGDYVTTFDGSPVLIADSDAILIDPDSTTISRMDVKITNLLDGANESLAADTSAFPNLNASYNSTFGTLLITGSGTLAEYEAVLRTIEYDNSSAAPDTTSRSISVEVTDGGGFGAISFSTINFAGVPTDLSSGIELNADGGNDAYLISNAGLATSLTATTFEIQFAANNTPNETVFMSFNNGAGDEYSIQTDDINGGLELDLGAGVSAFSTAINYETALLDGQPHSLAVTWDSTHGDWAIYIDGELVDSGSALNPGVPLDTTNGRFVFGQEQDAPNAGYDAAQHFSGTIYDIRIWDEARTQAEIALDYRHKYDSNTLPDGLVANWQMDGLTPGSQVVDVVNGNNLSVANATGPSFAESVPVDDLHIVENAAAGTTVGYVVPSDSDVTQDIANDGLFLQAVDPGTSDRYTAGQTFGGWTVRTGSVDLLGDYAETSPLGGRSVELSGSGPGGIYQTLNTTAGRQYQVVFGLSGNWNGGEAIKDLRVSAAGQSQDYAVSEPNGWDDGLNMLFADHSFTFTATGSSTDLDFLSLDAGDLNSIIADVRVIEVPTAVTAILANDSTLTYDAATDKFYQFVNTSGHFDVSLAAATASNLNGVSGQLVTIDSAYENDLIQQFAVDNTTPIWLGARDTNDDGNWNWLDGSVESNDEFWVGGSGGSPATGFYAPTFGQSEIDGEDYARMNIDGTWADDPFDVNRAYVIEWDASEVLSSFTFSLTDPSNNFEINNSTGEITAAATNTLDYEVNTSHDVTVEVTNAAGSKYSEVMTILVDDVLAVADSYTTDEDTPLTVAAPGVMANDFVPPAVDNTVLGFDAATDTDGNATWTSNTGSLALNGAAGITYTTSPDNAPAGITAAFDFDGSFGGFTAAALGDLPEIDSTQSATIETWILVDNPAADQIIFDSGHPGNGGADLAIQGGELLLVIGEAGTDTSGQGGTLTAGTWHHIAVTFDMDAPIATATAYLDGVQAVQVSLGTFQNWSQNEFGLGDQNGFGVGGFYSPFAGQISHFRVQDAILSSAEISANAASPGAPASSLAQVVSFDDSATAGTVVVNSDGSFTYDPNGQFTSLTQGQTATDTFTYTLDDGYGGQETTTVTMTIDGIGVAAATQTVPGPQNVNEDQVLTFTGANAVSVSDTLVGTDSVMQVRLSVDDGVLNLSGLNGLTVIGGAQGTSMIAVEGTESDINTALDGMTFTPDGDFNGNVTLNMTTALPSDDFVGNYTFEGNANDVGTGAANDGTLVNGAQIIVDPTRGQVLSLDGGNQHVQIAGMYGNPADITLAAWVNVNAVGGEADIISLGDNVAIRSEDSSRGFQLVVRTNGTWQKVFSNINIAGNGWTHVAATVTDSTGAISLYIDGVEVATGIADSSIQYDRGTNTRIGMNGNIPSQELDGLVDDVRVYTTALSASEIADLPNGITNTSGVSDTVAITVDPINDAPELDNSGTMTLTDVNEDDVNSAGNSVEDILASAGGDRITDVDAGSVEGIALTSVDNTNGTWQYKVFLTDAWTDVPPITTGDALLLNPASLLRFVPDPDYTGTSGDITFRAWDRTGPDTAGSVVTIHDIGGSQPYSTAEESASLNVINVNDAPVIDNNGTPQLTAITEDDLNSSGNTIAEILTSDGAIDPITDIDGDPEGIAITSLSGNGTWQYDTGAGWTDVGTVSTISALLLGETDSLRYVPDGVGGETAVMIFQAWDQTSGTAGTKVDSSVSGGTTAFSDMVEAATIAVTDVNDAPTFGVGGADGVVITDFSTNDQGRTLAIQTDGKIVVGGTIANELSVARYNEDGSLDTSFGFGGFAVAGPVGNGYRVTLQNDGQILLAGESGGSLTVARFDTTGALDPNFGVNGVATIGVPTNGFVGTGVDVQQDGRILVTYNSGTGVDVVRLLADGSQDPTFGNAGIVNFAVSGAEETFNVIVDDSGRIIAVGDGGPNDGIIAARFDTNGIPDPTFSNDGYQEIAFPGGGIARGKSVEVLPDGSVLIAGYASGTTNAGVVVKLDSAGELDPTFGVGGIIQVNVNASTELVQDIFLMDNGQFVVSGYIGTEYFVGKFNADGTPDAAFAGGIVSGNFGGIEQVRGVAVDANDRVVISGYTNAEGDNDFVVARYNVDGTLDTTFDFTGALDGNPTFVEDGPPVVLDADVQIFDAELTAIDDFGGTTLTLERVGGPNSNDDFRAIGTLSFGASDFFLSNVNIGSYSMSPAGTLSLTFAAGVTNAQVNEAMQQITYENLSNTPPASVDVEWTFNDGNVTAQGTGGALEVVGTTTVDITPNNDAPELDLDADDSSGATGVDFNTTYVAGGAPVPITDTDMTLTDVDSTLLSQINIVIGSGTAEANDVLTVDTTGTSLNTFYNVGNQTMILSGSGTPAEYEQVLRTLTYHNTGTPTNANKEISFFVLDDLSRVSSIATTDVTVQGDNTAPVVAGNTGSSVNEGSTDTIEAAELSYTDDLQPPSAVTYTVTSAANHGYLAIANAPSTPITSFTQLDINSNNLIYVHNGSETVSDSFTFTVDDGQGNSVIGQIFNITVLPQNDAPLHTLPGAQTTLEETPLVFSAANGNQITISDADASASQIQVTLSADNGTLTLSATPGITIISGTGTNATTVTFQGTQAAANNAIDGLTYTPTTDFNGAASIYVQTNDLGNSGDGGPQAVLDTINVTVNPVNDAPTLVTGTINDLVVDEDSGITSLELGGLTHSPGGGAAETTQTLKYNVTVVPSASLGAIVLADQTTVVSPGTYSLAEIQGMHFRTLQHQHGTTFFEFQAVDDGGTLNGGVEALNHSIQIDVNPVNDAPVLNTTATLSMTDISEDDATPVGDTVANIIASDGVDQITDVDANALEGMAVYAVDNTNGSWEYTTDGGGSWIPFGSINPSSVVLLDPSAMIRFVPNPDFNGTSTFDFHAWDQTIGTNGQTGFDMSANGTGATTAFSVAGDTVTLNILAVNDAPIVDLDENDGGEQGLAFNTTFTEGNGPVLIADVDAAISDVDDTNLTQLTVAITNPLDGSDERLVANVSTTGLSANFDTGTGTLTIFGNGTVADYQQVLRTISYENLSSNPDTTQRILSVVASDSSTSSLVAQSRIDIASVDDIPVVDLNGADAGNDNALTYTENDAATNIAPLATVNDFSEGDITAITLDAQGFQDFGDAEVIIAGGVTIAGGTAASGNITVGGTTFLYDYDGGNAFDFTNSVAANAPIPANDVELLIRSIQYQNLSDAPATTAIDFDFTIADASGQFSSVPTSALTFIAVNDDPLNSGTAPTTHVHLEDGITAVDLSAIDLSDVDAGNGNLTLTISTSVGHLRASEGLLPVTLGGGQSTITVTGSLADLNDWLNDASLLEYETSVPNGNGPNFDQLTITINDNGNTGIGGSTDIPLGSVQIDVTPVNDAPVLDNTGINSLPTIAEDATNTTGDTVANVIGSAGGDSITDVDPGAIEGIGIYNADSTNGTWEYSTDGGTTWIGFGNPTSTATLLLGENTMVRFEPSPDFTGDASFSYVAWDQTTGTVGGTLSLSGNTGGTGTFSTELDTAFITVTPANDAPTVDLDADDSSGTSGIDYNTTFAFGGAAIPLADGVSITDIDGPIQQLTIQITNIADGQNEILSHTPNAAINSSYSGGILQLINTGNATNAMFEDVVNSLTYQNTSTISSDLSQRIITFVANDGTATSPVATAYVDLIADTTAPAAINNTGITVDEGSAELIDATELMFDDTAQPTAFLTYTVATGPSNGILVNLSNITVPIATFTQTQIDAGEIAYIHNDSQTTSDSFEFTVDDGAGNSTAIQNFNINVTPVNDAPVLTNPSNTFSLTDVVEDDTNPPGDLIGSILTSNLPANGVTDVDPGALGGVAITSVDTTNGTWQYSTNGGTSWTTFGAVSTNSATVLDPSAMIRFVPNANYNGPSGTIGFHAWDQTDRLPSGQNGVDITSGMGGSGAYSTAETNARMSITPVNDAPVTGGASAAGSEDVATAINLNATDVDGTIASFSLLDLPQNVTLYSDAALTNAITIGVDLPTTSGLLTIYVDPDADWSGITTFNYTSTDNQGTVDTTPAVATINILPVDDAPVVSNSQFSTAEDSSYVSTLGINDLLTNVTDADGDPLTVDTTPVSGPVNGTLALNPNGTFTYTPNQNYTGSDQFTYRVLDGTGLDATAVVSITVTPVNDAPIANNDVFIGAEDTTITSPGSILQNDSDIDGDILTVSLVTDVTSGTLQLNPNGTFSYTPDGDFHGGDSFTYEVSDGNGGTAQATVTLEIASVNDAPVANNDSFNTEEDTSITANLLANDTDVDSGDSLTVNPTPVSQPSNGTVILNSNGTFTYTPDENFAGVDSFSYEISDSLGATSQATVFIDVGGTNDPPTPTDDNFTTNEDTPFTATLGIDDLLLNDTDIDGDPLTVNPTPVVAPTNGTVTLNTDGTFTYTPNENFHGTDAFTYLVDDGQGGTAQANANITVLPVDDAPLATADEYTLNEDTSLVTTQNNGVLLNDVEVDGELIQANTTPVVGPNNGTLVLNSDGTFDYTPDDNFTGVDFFVYEVSDSNGTTAQATVTLNVLPTNDAPLAANDAFTTSEDTTFTSTLGVDDLLLNDTDPDGDSLLVSITPVTAPTNGTLTLSPNGMFTYQPDTDFAGTDTFTYEVLDPSGAASQATVTITVTPINDAPVANDDAYVALVGETLIIPAGSGLSSNDSDPEGDALATYLLTAPNHGTVVVNSDGSFTYVHDGSPTMADSFEYQLVDANGEVDTGTVNIAINTPPNDAPIANNDQYALSEGGAIAEDATTGVLSNDVDADGDPLQLTLLSGTTNGTLTLNPDGSFSYVHDGSETTTDGFTYQIDDGNGGSSIATVDLNIAAVNDAPIAAADTYTMEPGQPLEIAAENGLLINDTDIDSGSLQALLASGPSSGQLTLNPDGSLSYVPNAGFFGTDSFTYVASDGNSNSAAVTVLVEVPAIPLPTPPPEPEPEDGGSGGEDEPTNEDPVDDPIDTDTSSTPPISSGDTGTPPGVGQPDPTTRNHINNENGLDRYEETELPTYDAVVAQLEAPQATNDFSTFDSNDITQRLRQGLKTAANSLGGFEFAFSDVFDLNTPIPFDQLLSLREQIESNLSARKAAFGTATVLGSAVTAGYVVWTVRGGYLLATLLTSVPAWKVFDPLPILRLNAGAKTPKDDESLEELIENNQTTVPTN